MNEKRSEGKGSMFCIPTDRICAYTVEPSLGRILVSVHLINKRFLNSEVWKV